ncbi:MAG: hypothetical protein M1820_010735 [Bogoriella megaspora]|nr:MAG: hypothetical protein M1820_010735 [Bogoriella megaspora]
MKLTTATTLLLTASAAVASPHRHLHRHLAKRVDDIKYDVVHVMVYELDGKPISKADVDEGIKNGSLVLAPNGEISSVAPAPPAATSPSVQAAPPSSSAAAAAPSISSAAKSYQPAPAPAPAPAPPSSDNSDKSDKGDKGDTPSVGGSDSDWSNAAGPGIDDDFPDGKIDCSVFPKDYGAKPAPWLNLGDWSGVQIPGSGFVGLNKGAVTNIESQTSGTCKGADCCKGGAFCSYACPADYLKSQWPAGNQGQTGQSVGGLYCHPDDNKLYLTNPNLSKKLCIKGATDVNVKVASSLKHDIPICRTDYPGYETMSVPTIAQGGDGSNATTPLACVSGATYYHWQGASNNANYATSGQYYVSASKYSVSQACVWGNLPEPTGNYAPIILGVGVDQNNKGWFSIDTNSQKPQGAELDFGIRIQSNDGVNFCDYSPGKGFTSVTGTNDQGCTVEIDEGDVVYSFYPLS